MSSNEFDFEDAIYDLGVLLCDETQGVIVNTLKKNFYEEYKNFDLITAWECFVDEVNRVNTVCELHDYLIDLDLDNNTTDEVIAWIDNKIKEIKPYDNELCQEILVELKEFIDTRME